MIDKDFLRAYNFNSSQIDQMTEDEYAIIRNFFNVPEINKMNPASILQSARILLPILKKIEIVNMHQYVDDLRKHATTVEPNDALDNLAEKPLAPSDSRTGVADADPIQEEFNRLLKGRYITEQVWILEHLINNPNLFMKGEKAEAIKNKLKEKELEQLIHNHFLNLFLEKFNVIEKPNLLLDMRHFAFMKEILEFRKQVLILRNPVNFRGLVEVFEECGFEGNNELNASICRILAEITDNQKIEKILRFGIENFKEVKLSVEKRKVIAKLFK